MEWNIIGAIGGSVVATIGVMKLVGRSSWTLSGRISSIEGNIQAGQVTMQGMQVEIKRMGDLLEKITDLRGDIRVLENRIGNAEQDIREMKHGEGYVLPLKSPYERP